MPVMTVSEARRDLFGLIDDVAEEHRGYCIVGNLQGAISRRINIQRRLVCQVLESEHVVKVLRMWTHYE